MKMFILNYSFENCELLRLFQVVMDITHVKQKLILMSQTHSGLELMLDELRL